VRLMDNTKGSDYAYPGVEVLPGCPCVATTYEHWTEGESPVRRQRTVQAPGTRRPGEVAVRLQELPRRGADAQWLL
jgi:hypothetical protein